MAYRNKVHDYGMFIPKLYSSAFFLVYTKTTLGQSLNVKLIAKTEPCTCVSVNRTCRPCLCNTSPNRNPLENCSAKLELAGKIEGSGKHM